MVLGLRPCWLRLVGVRRRFGKRSKNDGIYTFGGCWAVVRQPASTAVELRWVACSITIMLFPSFFPFLPFFIWVLFLSCLPPFPSRVRVVSFSTWTGQSLLSVSPVSWVSYRFCPLPGIRVAQTLSTRVPALGCPYHKFQLQSLLTLGYRVVCL